VNLTEEYGAEKAIKEPLWCIEGAAATLLRRLTALPS
jgi:hypothetical protein